MKTIFIADEWDNFLERIGRAVSTDDDELQQSSSDSLELRFWASYRGQTLARTGYNIHSSPSPQFHLYPLIF